MHEIIDLSQEIYDGMPVYKGLPQCKNREYMPLMKNGKEMKMHQQIHLVYLK
jgi:kynurenine formamidase